jgi:RNA polymerase sigma-70 factor (ECF subfamily)
MADSTELIWQSLSNRLRTFIARRVNNEADVDDILQDVFLRIHQRLATLKRADRLLPWLFQITRNSIVDYYRSPRRRHEVPLALTADAEIEQHKDHRIVSEPAIDPERVRKELSACLRPMIQRLPADYRKAIFLVALDGITQRAAAQQLELSLSGLKSRVQRGREKLKIMLHQCCHIQLDRDGGIIDYETQNSACQSCDV